MERIVLSDLFLLASVLECLPQSHCFVSETSLHCRWHPAGPCSCDLSSVIDELRVALRLVSVGVGQLLDAQVIVEVPVVLPVTSLPALSTQVEGP